MFCTTCDTEVNDYGHYCADRTETDWHITNRIMCDWLHRKKELPRVRRPTDNELQDAENSYERHIRR